MSWDLIVFVFAHATPSFCEALTVSGASAGTVGDVSPVLLDVQATVERMYEMRHQVPGDTKYTLPVPASCSLIAVYFVFQEEVRISQSEHPHTAQALESCLKIVGHNRVAARRYIP